MGDNTNTGTKKNPVNSTWGKILVCVFLSVAVMFIVELFANIKILGLPKNEKGISALEVLENNGVYTVTPDRYVDKLVLEYSADESIYFSYKIEYYNTFGYTEQEHIVDESSIYMNHSVINIGKKVKSVTVDTYTVVGDIQGAKIGINLDGISVKNEAALNPFRMLFVFAVVMTVEMLVFFRKFISKKLEYGFLIIGLFMGMTMVISMPIARVGWDEEMHLTGAYTMDVTGTVEYNEFTQDFLFTIITNNPHEHTNTIEEYEEFFDKVNEYSDLNYGSQIMVRGSHLPGMHMFAYVFTAITCNICKLLGAGLATTILLIRMTNMIMYVVCIFFAIRKLPKGKLLMAVIALMPTPMFLACTASYDPVLTGFMYLGLAYLFAPLLEERQITLKEYLVFLFATGYAATPKAVYIPMILLGLFLPSKCFKDKKTERLMKGGVILAFLAGMGSFILPEIVSPEVEGDLRGGDTSHTRQMDVLMAYPLGYVKVLLTMIKETFCEFVFGRMALDNMAHLGVGTGYYIIPMFLTFVTITGVNPEMVKDEEGKERYYGFRPYFKVLIWIGIFGVVCLVWTAMYLAFTEVGKDVIAGVQGRYYIPLLFPLLYSLSFNKFHSAYDKVKYNMVCLLFTCAILFYAVWQLVMVNCL